jgi:long-subunit fatty acid transport protein
MRRTRTQIIMAALVLGTLTGCGSAKRIDATSQETLKTSMAAMKASMNEADSKQFQADVTTVQTLGTVKEDVAPGLTSKKQKTALDTFKPIDGMSAADIHARAEELRAQAKKPAK